MEEAVDKTLLKEADYLSSVSHEFRVRLKKLVDIQGKVNHIHIHVHAPSFITSHKYCCCRQYGYIVYMCILCLEGGARKCFHCIQCVSLC